MILVNIRDHPRRQPSECWDWCKTNAKGRWDFVQVDGRDGAATSLTSPEWSGEPHGGRPFDPGDPDSIRPADADRSASWGVFYDEMLARKGRRRLAMLKQFVRVKMAFEDPGEAKAFRRWLRGDEAPPQK